MRTKHFMLAALAAMSMFTACDKYDDGEIRDNLAAIDNRVTALEGKVTTLEGAMSALQTVVDRNYSITAFEKIDNGYKLTFTTGETLELLNGEKGDTGATGAQGEKGDKGDTGATGAQGEKGDKGDKGDTGATGATGAQGEKGDKGDTGATGAAGDSFFKSVTQDGGFIVIVLKDNDNDDTNNPTYKIPCNVITIGDDLTSTSIAVEANKSKDIAINIPDGIEVASVTATVTYSNGVASNTATRAGSITEWATTVAKDFKKVTVEVPATANGNALLQVIVTKANSEGYTAFKALTIIKGKMTASFEPSDASVKVKQGNDNVWGSTLTRLTRAAWTQDGEDLKFAYSVGDKVTVTNSEISSTQNPFYTFTRGADNKFTSEDASPTENPATWTAYFPSNQISLAGQSGKLEDLAKYYMFVGTENGITGKESLSIKMEAKCAVLVIDNRKGNIDINVKRSAEDWVDAIITDPNLGVGISSQSKKVSLLTATATGTYYVVNP